MSYFTEIFLKNVAKNRINPATSDAQTDGSQNGYIVDSAGNEIASHLTTDGDYHLGVQIQQDVQESTGNTSGVNLAAGGIKAKTDYEPIPIDLLGLPFSNGLTIDINTKICNVLVIYE